MKTISAQQARVMYGSYAVQFIDLREVRELEREGMIDGAFHAPRGMLEFWVDPESPYFKPVFSENKKFVFFCAAGWRSALAAKTVKGMGLPNVMPIDGGFGAWKALEASSSGTE